MASYTVKEVLDLLWNESGDEEDISGDEFDKNDGANVGANGANVSLKAQIMILRVLQRRN